VIEKGTNIRNPTASAKHVNFKGALENADA
jgi:hypothetical protein